MDLEDYVVKDGEHYISGHQAIYEFPNGYALSVVQGPLFYTSADKPYEVAVKKFSTEGGWNIEEVYGYMDEKDLHELAEKVFSGEFERENGDENE